ncbi:uncharacterized protein C20orf96 homolog [Rhynchocyon petersi]
MGNSEPRLFAQLGSDSLRPRSRGFVSQAVLDDFLLAALLSDHRPKTVLKSRRASLQELKKHEKFLTERNQDLVKAIQNMEENTARKMRGILQQQNILENIVDTLERWSRESLEELKCELQEWEKKEERKMHCLEQQVEQLNAKIKKTLEEINFLSTYMDHEYPVKVVQIATLVRQIQQLKDIQQDELYDLSEMRKMVLQSLSNDIQRKKEDFLKSLAMRILQPHEEILVQKARDNQLMLKYMDKFRDFIDQSVGEMPLLRTQVQHLQVQVQKHREIIFEDILLRRPKCTPDMDVILNIPVEEMLPF